MSKRNRQSTPTARKRRRLNGPLRLLLEAQAIVVCARLGQARLNLPGSITTIQNKRLSLLSIRQQPYN